MSSYQIVQFCESVSWWSQRVDLDKIERRINLWWSHIRLIVTCGLIVFYVSTPFLHPILSRFLLQVVVPFAMRSGMKLISTSGRIPMLSRKSNTLSTLKKENNNPLPNITLIHCSHYEPKPQNMLFRNKSSYLDSKRRSCHPQRAREIWLAESLDLVLF